ncbi:MAG: restriction endonuclease subunit S [Lachnospiraceae bacterium]|nr:restriction endonuclease subunit S [Lachnospiraceae bacterium]
MSERKLKEFLEEYSVKNKNNEPLPVYSVTNSKGFCTEYFNKDVSSKDKKSYKIVPRGYFAYNPSRINVGSVDWQDCEDAVIVSPLYVIFRCSEELNQEYLKYYLKSKETVRIINEKISGSVRNSLKFDELCKFEIKYMPIEQQLAVVESFKKIEMAIAEEMNQLSLLDELIKSFYVDIFGDLKKNPHNWRIYHLSEVATIDTQMIHDFSGYENFPHIGIDSIEKDTGKILDYRTISEDGVISGKYLFSPEHIIYSKIRPNLNKVALPDFEGLCSADAYPILVNKELCNRVFLAYTMRSNFYLDYILTFSGRANMPKVNKNQVNGFSFPLPPKELQEKFAQSIAYIERLKDEANKRIELYNELLEKTVFECFYC